VFRYEKQNDLVMSYLKCISGLSAANAANALFDSGYIAEVMALSRICNDCFEDVLFLASPLGDESNLSKNQREHIEEYFLEEFSEEGTLPEAQAVRHRVPRSKIQSAIANLPNSESNPHNRRENQSMLFRISSGSVHSAYFQAMDLYGGYPTSFRFHVNGISDQTKVNEYALAFHSAVNNVASSIIIVAKRCDQSQTATDLEAMQIEFGKAAKLF